jgi:hypothetical protein
MLLRGKRCAKLGSPGDLNGGAPWWPLPLHHWFEDIVVLARFITGEYELPGVIVVAG